MSALTIFWAVLGISLWVIEVFTPGLIAGSIGTAALLMLLVGLPIASPALQFFVFALLSAAFIAISNRLVPKMHPELDSPFYREQVTVTTDILPGELGRVAFQGTTWSARCELSDLPLSVGTKVMIVGQKGNVLEVMPINMLAL